ncbi:hypothetical protein L1S32_08150 [Methanogenium sp. S4BF]|uniref:hypothetical protein n=1 Tax=Methanogenium sp. S4BF TaxID=1789226 RepID=UPI00241762CF|nr:hypothetical protein [Methanogenium sp. S4BF]WFN33812.1 hypothetical protein L1S32_08150 [Methanogenium sp. S4BF]
MATGENTGMDLEAILLLTGEMDHMKELLHHYARDKSGISPQEMLECVIHPLLDELEDYLKSEVSAPQDAEYLKAVVHRWIDARLNG